MKYFHYKIEEDEVKEATGEIQNIPADFIEFQNDFGVDKIYYKIQDAKITDVIGEAFHEAAARRRVEDFISALNVNLF